MTLLPDTLFVGAIDLALKDLLATAGQTALLPAMHYRHSRKDQPQPHPPWQIGQWRTASHFTKDNATYRTT